MIDQSAKAKRLIQCALSAAMFKIVNSSPIDYGLLKETALLAKKVLAVIG